MHAYASWHPPARPLSPLPLLLNGSPIPKKEAEIFETEKGPLKITPVFHATMVIEWNGMTMYVDPFGGGKRFDHFPAPDLVLITHHHTDHLNYKTLDSLNLSEAELIVPKMITDTLQKRYKDSKVNALGNGDILDRNEAHILAVPMYNHPGGRHLKGEGNGYVLTLGGKRIYISGDTEGIEEIRQLQNIDIAFVCMNLPFTMGIDSAASAVLTFKPRIVYPFHFMGRDTSTGGETTDSLGCTCSICPQVEFSDVAKFKQLVNAEGEDIEVRIRNWYP